LTFCGLIGYI